MLSWVFFGLAGALVFVNIYFRLKVLKIYKQLIQQSIGISPGQLWNKERLEQELLAVYPRQAELIRDLRRQIIRSLGLAVALWVAIIGAGAIVYLLKGR